MVKKGEKKKIELKEISLANQPRTQSILTWISFNETQNKFFSTGAVVGAGSLWSFLSVYLLVHPRSGSLDEPLALASNEYRWCT
jgi:hypothetical protein